MAAVAGLGCEGGQGVMPVGVAVSGLKKGLQMNAERNY